MNSDTGATRRTSISLHRCPATGCTVQLPTRLLMCVAHWDLVPASLKEEVNRLWKAGDMRTYWVARKAAVDAVNSQLEQDSAVATG